MSYQCANRILARDWEGARAAAVEALERRGAVRSRLVRFDLVRYYETEALLWAGEVDRARGDLLQLRRSLTSSQEDRRYRLVCLRMEAILARHEGRLDDAGSHLEGALQLATEIGLPGEEWQVAATLAGLHRARRSESKAQDLLARALTVVERLGLGIHDQALRGAYLTEMFRRAHDLAG